MPSSATPFLKRLSKLSRVSSGCSSTFIRAELWRPRWGSQTQRAGLPAPCARLTSALLLEAGAAIDGAVLSRLEWHLRLNAAGGANRRIHLARTAIGTAAAAPVSAAGWAARRRVLQATGSVEFLLPAGPDEVGSAVAAGQGLVLKAHSCPPLLETITSTETETASETGPPCPCIRKPGLNGQARWVHVAVGHYIRTWGKKQVARVGRMGHATECA